MRQALKSITPPILISAAKRLRNRLRPPPVETSEPAEYEYVPEGWARAGAEIRGWNVDSVLDAYRTKLPAFRKAIAGPEPIGTQTSAAKGVTEATVEHQNTVLAFAYALALASRQHDHLSILDWGGGLGYFYYLTRALLPDEVDVEYHIKDVPLIARHGRDAVPEVTFWDDDSCLGRGYDLVFASSALQYSQAWSDDLARLARASQGYLFLTRVPVVFHAPSFVVLQRTDEYVRFDTEFLSWVFNEGELIAVASNAGMQLTREFLIHGRPQVDGAPEEQELRGYLFRAGPG